MAGAEKVSPAPEKNRSNVFFSQAEAELDVLYSTPFVVVLPVSPEGACDILLIGVLQTQTMWRHVSKFQRVGMGFSAGVRSWSCQTIVFTTDQYRFTHQQVTSHKVLTFE